VLELRNVDKQYIKHGSRIRVLQDISLAVDKGEYVAVQGPSGCGKTTLLLITGALLRPDRGRVLFNGIDLYNLGVKERGEFRASNVGFVFQQYHLIPYLTVLENVMTPDLARRRGDTLNRGLELLERLSLSHRRNHRPAELSAGEKQRAALARALITGPELLLADEITGNLDDRNAGIVLDFVKNFVNGGGTVMMVTHDEKAAAVAHRTWSLAPVFSE